MALGGIIRAAIGIAGLAFVISTVRASKNIAEDFADWSSDVRTLGLLGTMAAARNDAGGAGAERATATKQIMSLTHDGRGYRA